MEQVLAPQRDQYQAELGKHWELAGKPEQAQVCYLAAARQARERSDLHEAERLYRCYLDLLIEHTEESLGARKEYADVLLGKASAILI